jgi:hypothetical protein
MRHLLSVLLSLVLAPLVYVASGFSAAKFGEANANGQIEVTPAALGLAAAVAAGGLYALLVMARLSPVGPALAGLLYLGSTVWALLSRGSFQDIVPADLFGVEGALHAPVGAGTTLLSIPLLLTVVSSRRWRRTAEPAPAAPFDAAPDYGDAPTLVSPPTYGATAAPAPAYEPPSYESSGYEPPTYGSSIYTPPTAEPGGDSPSEQTTVRP